MDKKTYTYNRLIGEGIPPHVAAGIVGNLDVESGFSDDVISFQRRGDQGTAYGIAQWRLDRKDNLLKFAGDRASTLDGQIDFLVHELKNSPEYGYSQLLKSKSVEEAATIFQDKYERPNPKYAHTNSRIKSALGVYGKEDPNYVAGSYSTTPTNTYTNSEEEVDNYLPDYVLTIDAKTANKSNPIPHTTTQTDSKIEEEDISKKNEAKIKLLEAELANMQQVAPQGNPYEVKQAKPVQQQPTYTYLQSPDLFRINS